MGDEGGDREPLVVEEDATVQNVTDLPQVPDERLSKKDKWRNIIGFWILGLCTDYPYIILLSAAYDILGELQDSGGDTGHKNSSFTGGRTLLSDDSSDGRDCHKQSTAVVLLADTLPTLILKLTLPYVMNFIPYWIRVLTVVLFSALCFIVVGLNGFAFTSEELVIFGVVCASIGVGIGEVTFLAFTSRYDKSTVTGWSSGSGAAGLLATVVYLVLRVGLSAQVTLLIQVFTPFVLLVTYLFVLGKPGKILPTEGQDERHQEVDATVGHVQASTEDEGVALLSSADSENVEEEEITAKHPFVRSECVGMERGREKRFRLKLFNREELDYWWSHVKYIPKLLMPYMLPLFAVYLAEYMINQGLYELFLYPDTHLGSIKIDRSAQYRVLELVYSIGVLISRSSIAVVRIKHYWVLALLQVVNFYFLFCEVIYLFIPSFWITLFIILFEGMLGGAVFANAFYAISKQVPKVHREFSMGVASVADSVGIVLAAVLALFLHDYVCKLPT